MPALRAIISGDQRPLAREFQMIERAAARTAHNIAHEFGGKLGAVASVAGIEQAIHGVAEYGEHVSVLADRLGISTSAIQAWDYALKMSGSSIDSAVPFFEKLALARKKAMDGNETMVASFRKLGVSLSDLKSRRLEDIGIQISEAFKSANPQSLIADLRSIGGRGAGELVSAFRSGLGELVVEADRIGVIIDESVIAKLRQSAEQFKTLGAEMRAAFAPAVGWLADLSTGLWRMLQRAGIVAVTLPLFGRKAAQEESTAMESKWKEDDAAAKARAGKRSGGFVDAGDDVDEKGFNKAARETERSAEKILRLKEELFRLQEANDLKSLSREDQIQELYHRRAAIIEAMKETRSEEGRLNAAIDVEKIDSELRQAEKEKDPKEGRNKVLHGHLTELQRVGGYAPQASIVVDVAHKQLAALNKIQKTLESHGEHLKEMKTPAFGAGRF